jgi:hypothetical protein
LAVAPLGAQAPDRIAGRVMRVAGTDTLPASGVLVSLHRIGRTAQGVVDSARTPAHGRFGFRVRPDTTAVFLVSARHAGIEYFSDPAQPGRDTALALIVSDTSSAVRLELSARHVIVGRPEADGRPVLDLITLANRSDVTRVAPDTLTPTWSLRLPSGARNLEVEQGDLSPTAVEQRGDSVRVFAPIPPGRKHLMIGYRLPGDGDEFSWLAPADTFDLLLEEEGASVRGGGLVATGPVDLSGKLLQRWTAAPPTPGTVVVRFGPPGGAGATLLTALVARPRWSSRTPAGPGAARTCRFPRRSEHAARFPRRAGAARCGVRESGGAGARTRVERLPAAPRGAQGGRRSRPCDTSSPLLALRQYN